MDNALSSIIYILIDILGTYLIFCYIRFFINTTAINKKFEIGSYVLVHIINYIVIQTVKDIIPLLITNLTLLFCLTLNYKTSLIRKLFAVSVTTVINLSAEIICQLIFVDLIEPEIISNYVSICSKIIMLGVGILISKFLDSSIKSKKSYVHWYVPIVYAMAILLLDVIIEFTQFDLFHKILSVVLMLSMFISLFYIHKLDQEKLKLENRLVQQRIDLYEMQYKQLHNSYSKFNSLRHKLKNQFLNVNGIINGNYGEDNKLRELMDDILMETLDIESTLIETDNLEIDSIINARIKEIEEISVKVKCKILIPEQMGIEKNVFNIILNNVFDAVKKELIEGENKDLSFIMKYDSEYVCTYWIYSYEDSDDIYKSQFLKRNKKLIKDVRITIKPHSGRLYFDIEDNKIIWSIIMYAGTI